MRNPLYGDVAQWKELSLLEKIEAIRLHFCTGPCGQSSQTMTQRERINEALRQVKAELSPLVKAVHEPI